MRRIVQIAGREATAYGWLAACLVGTALVAGCGSSGSPTVEEATSDDEGKDGSAGPGRRGDGGVPPVIDIDPGSIIGGGGADGGLNSCTKATCEDFDYDCGKVADGCGGVLDCGRCDEGAACGIVQHNVCTPLQTLCVPIEKDEACDGKQCGQEGDGCGGLYDCGACADGEACGVEEAFQCDALPEPSTGEDCVPAEPEAACAGRECGVVFDGCGTESDNEIDCAAHNDGGCADGEYCGIRTPFQCDAPVTPECEPVTCADLGWECGVAVDDCGNEIDCAAESLSCSSSEVCVGGIDGPTECIAGGGGPSTADCDVCDSIPVCTGDAVTKLAGRVITPGKSDADTANQVGVPNAFVYILRNNDPSELPAISEGIPAEGGDYGTSCDRCVDQDLGPVLASATTNARGEYELTGNIPVGEEFQLVVKIGKWRRAQAVTLDSGACETIPLPALQTRLPRTQNDGSGAHIPRIAISTGMVDAMECVFYKLGVAGSEFTLPGDDGSAAGRIHMYRAAGNRGGARMANGANTPDSALYENRDRIFSYDTVVFDCEGEEENHNAHDAKVREFVNRGGRMFASHWSYSWLHDNGSQSYDANDPYGTGLSQSAIWGSGSTAQDEGYVSVDRPGANPNKIQKFADWLVHEGAATYTNNRYQIDIAEPRDLARTVGESSEEFVYRTYGNGNRNSSVQQYAFNTPYGAPEEAICGRVAYSGFHVVAPGDGNYRNTNFPDHCGGDLTDQEKVLLYMLFDLGACVSTDEPEAPSCEPQACGDRCGIVPDGCGGTTNCGPCPPPNCSPTTCAAEGANCGAISDGCGGVLQCGPCENGQVCGAHEPNQCGSNPSCNPRSCASANAECGVIGDGCGGTKDCGVCEPGFVCGIEEAFQCGPAPECVPLTCEERGAECGTTGDGCGAAIDCGQCPAGAVCGLLRPNECDVPRVTK